MNQRGAVDRDVPIGVLCRSKYDWRPNSGQMNSHLSPICGRPLIGSPYSESPARQGGPAEIGDCTRAASRFTALW